MNGHCLLLFAFYFTIHSCKPYKMNKKIHIVRMEAVENLRNITNEYLSLENNTRYLNETTSPIYSSWSPWSRCEKCVQFRFRKCTNYVCNGKKMYEEKQCKKKRCARKKHMLKSYGDMHVVTEIRESSLSTRTMHSRIWTRWSDWSVCTRKCRTKRYRTCKKPGKCKKEKQVQSAFCYHEQTQCHYYVLHLMGNNGRDPSQYTYGSPFYNFDDHTWKKKCGRPFGKTKMLKIIGGTESEKNKWPWHVALQNAFLETFCGGTLIAPRWVLTAGHCLRKYLRVRLNEHDLTTQDGRERDLTVSRMFLHPQFDHVTVDNDIALLRLPISIRQPVACLPSSAPIPKQLCYVMGWGKEETHAVSGTSTLREAKIPIVKRSTCKHSYKNYVITSNMFCAGWKSGSADTCAGDSGGGLMCPLKKGNGEETYVVQGITSFGDGCGRRNKYGIYTKVNNYLKWIHKTIETYS